MKQTASELDEMIASKVGAWYALALRLLDEPTLAQSAVLKACQAARKPADTVPDAATIRNTIIAAAISELRGAGTFDVAPDPARMPKFDRFGVLIDKPFREVPAVEDLLHQPHLLSATRAALSELPGKFRTLLVLSDIEGLDTREIAEHMSLSVDAAKGELHTARLLLSSYLSPHIGEEN